VDCKSKKGGYQKSDKGRGNTGREENYKAEANVLRPRHEREQFKKSVMTGMGEGARGRGRPKMRWLDDVIGRTNLSLFDLRNAVDDIC